MSYLPPPALSLYRTARRYVLRDLRSVRRSLAQQFELEGRCSRFDLHVAKNLQRQLAFLRLDLSRAMRDASERRAA